MPSTMRNTRSRRSRTAARRGPETTAAGVWKEAGSIAADYMMARVPDSRRPAPAHRGRCCSRRAAASLLFVWWIRARPGSARDLRRASRRSAGASSIVVLLGGLRFALRAIAWMLCLEPPHRLPFPDAFGAVVAGDALGNLMPLGPIVSEPTKAAFVRRRGPARPGADGAGDRERALHAVGRGDDRGRHGCAAVRFDLPARAARGQRSGHRRRGRWSSWLALVAAVEASGV